MKNKGHGAGDGNRTHVPSLGSWCSTIELRPPIWSIIFCAPSTVTPWSRRRHRFLCALAHTTTSKDAGRERLSAKQTASVIFIPYSVFNLLTLFLYNQGNNILGCVFIEV